MKRIILLSIAALMTLSASSINASEVSGEVFQTEKKARKAKAEIKEVIFHVHLHCNNCVKKVQENIAFEKGVKGLEVSLENQTVTVKYDAAKTSEETLCQAIEKLGYKVGAEDHGHDHHHNHSHQ